MTTKARKMANIIGNISNDKLQSADLDVSFSNISDTGTEGTKVASGTTAQRGTTTGQFRYNSTTGKFEGRNSTGFIALEQNPTISSVNNTNITQAQIDANFDIVITGNNFSTGDTVKFVGNDNTEYTSPTVTIDSTTQITARINSNIDATKEPFKIMVTTTGGLTGSLVSAFNINASPIFATASGSLGTVFDSVRSSTTLTASATDPEGDTIAYSVQSGSLPSGASLNTSTGAITGFSAVGSDATSNFTLRATSGTNTSDRAYSITVKAPVTQAFTYTGATQTFTVPSGLTSIQAKVWGAAGAGHGQYYNCGGGAGGFGIGTLNLTGISSLNIVVGQGGQDRNSVSPAVGYQNKIATYGHLVSASTGENGGWGNNGGTGGGLSGIFNGVVTSQSNAIVIAGGGGAAGSVSGGGCGNSSGGYGGGFNQNGGDGNPNHDGANGRAGTTSAGGNNATVYYTRNSASNYTTANGGALHGGHGNTQDNGSSEGGGGGSGYFGGGAGSHGSPGGSWGAGGGGSGYANTSLVSSITASNAGSAGSANSTAEGDANWATGIGSPVAGDNDGGHGRVVLIY